MGNLIEQHRALIGTFVTQCMSAGRLWHKIWKYNYVSQDKRLYKQWLTQFTPAGGGGRGWAGAGGPGSAAPGRLLHKIRKYDDV